MLKYRKGTQTQKLDDLETLKVRLVRDGDGEGIWVKQGPDFVVLQNHALSFMPFQSWGVVLPSTNPSGPMRETIDVSHLEPDDGLELHPEAWETYREKGIIHEDGTFIPPERRLN
jgi:hypothetical protein